MIAIKGLRQGLLIVFTGAHEPWLTKLRELEEKFSANSSFFSGGQVAFDVRDLALSRDDLQRGIDLLNAHNVQLIAVLSPNEETRRAVRDLGIPDVLPAAPARTARVAQAPSPAVDPTPVVADQPAAPDSVAEAGVGIAVAPAIAPAPAADADPDRGTDGALLKRRVRSGQLIRHPGHVVVVGDVNPGAQIVAGGDIIVWGRLQGTVHAGAFGDPTAVVCALEMTPTLIRIADVTVRNHRGKAEQAHIKEQEITFTKWDKS